jgi:hypothetical protein
VVIVEVLQDWDFNGEASLFYEDEDINGSKPEVVRRQARNETERRPSATALRFIARAATNGHPYSYRNASIGLSCEAFHAG